MHRSRAALIAAFVVATCDRHRAAPPPGAPTHASPAVAPRAVPPDAQPADAALAAPGAPPTIADAVQLAVRTATLDAAGMRAILPPEGLHLCAALGVEAMRDVPSHTRCTLFAPAQITDALMASRVRLAIGSFRGTTIERLSTPLCRQDGEHIVCHANIDGPAGTQWTFAVDGTTLRLLEVLSYSLAS